MKLKSLALVAALMAAGTSTVLTSAPAFAQAKEQFFPVLVYRTGAYAPNGVPFANGYVDYLKLVNATRRHQRREDHLRGVRDRLRHRQGRRVL